MDDLHDDGSIVRDSHPINYQFRIYEIKIIRVQDALHLNIEPSENLVCAGVVSDGILIELQDVCIRQIHSVVLYLSHFTSPILASNSCPCCLSTSLYPFGLPPCCTPSPFWVPPPFCLP